ncbi:maleylpyruvate isomerase family mycothiol-dependent enzyme [Streptomyces olivaceiscleroticus]|uniref:Maleylpyruvate isomerase family mycothiol-dependent enzyme n=1 Tax=Streptomyces olivaceiscleroticus TaxID=68245 RepID=A0ABP3L2R6_9ACTN
MTRMTFDRHCGEIVAQTDLLRSHIQGADLSVPVPSCPGWTVNQLLRHLGGAQRWAAETVRGRVTEPLPEGHFRDLSPYVGEDPATLDGWLAEGAGELADALREAGPDAELWTPVPGERTAFYARRFAHETALHRADAALALGVPYDLDEEVALDAVDEWLSLGSLPMMFDHHPELRELLGPGRTLHFHATDTAPEAAEWVVDLTGDGITWRRAHEKAAVAVRGPLVELLLTLYRRRSPHDGTVEVIGDAKLLDFWQERVAFG